jgi:hypothetical protein
MKGSSHEGPYFSSHPSTQPQKPKSKFTLVRKHQDATVGSEIARKSAFLRGIELGRGKKTRKVKKCLNLLQSAQRSKKGRNDSSQR